MIRLGKAALAWMPCLLLPAAAQDFPILYDITGVAAGDTLAIHAEPSADSAVIGRLPHDAPGIEAVADTPGGQWMRVNLAGEAGWADLDLLRQRETDEYTLSRKLTCHGTEPFWTLELIQDATAVLSTPEFPPVAYSAGRVRTAIARYGRFSIHGRNADGAFSAVIRREYCDDGMTDAEFALGADLLVHTADGSYHMLGCCSLRP